MLLTAKEIDRYDPALIMQVVFGCDVANGCLRSLHALDGWTTHTASRSSYLHRRHCPRTYIPTVAGYLMHDHGACIYVPTSTVTVHGQLRISCCSASSSTTADINFSFSLQGRYRRCQLLFIYLGCFFLAIDDQ